MRRERDKLLLGVAREAAREEPCDGHAREKARDRAAVRHGRVVTRHAVHLRRKESDERVRGA